MMTIFLSMGAIYSGRSFWSTKNTKKHDEHKRSKNYKPRSALCVNLVFFVFLFTSVQTMTSLFYFLIQGSRCRSVWLFHNPRNIHVRPPRYGPHYKERPLSFF